MTTVTLELPDEIAAMLDTPEMRAEATAVLRDHFATAINGAAGDDSDIDPEALADITAAIEEAKTDPGLPLDEAFDQIEARFLARRAAA